MTYGNRLYDNKETPYSDEALEGYANYAAWATETAAPLHSVEIWNEINGTFCTGPARNDRVSAYLRMVQSVHAKVTHLRGQPPLFVGATAGVPLPFFRQLFEAGLLDYADGISFHPYRYRRPPEDLVASVEGLNELLKDYNQSQKKIPLYASEIGWAIKMKQTDGSLLTESKQADYLVRSLLLLHSTGVDQIDWYALLDPPHHRGMGLFEGPVNNPAKWLPRKSFTAYAVLLRMLQDHTAGDLATLQEKALYQFEFQHTSSQSPTLVFWAPKKATLTLTPDQASLLYDQYGSKIEMRSKTITLDMDSEVIYLKGRLTEAPQVVTNQTHLKRKLISDSRADFSISYQADSPWGYGWRILNPNSSVPLSEWTACQDGKSNDWKDFWDGPGQSFTISAKSQHPSKFQGQVVCASRRWTAPENGRYQFQVSVNKLSPKGDGTNLFWMRDGRILSETQLSPQSPTTPISEEIIDAKQGEAWEIVVGSGRSLDISYDATSLEWLVWKITTDD